MRSYWVYENKGLHEGGIHLSKCGHCNNGQGTQINPGNWSEFESLEAAINFSDQEYGGHYLCSHCLG